MYIHTYFLYHYGFAGIDVVFSCICCHCDDIILVCDNVYTDAYIGCVQIFKIKIYVTHSDTFIYAHLFGDPLLCGKKFARVRRTHYLNIHVVVTSHYYIYIYSIILFTTLLYIHYLKCTSLYHASRQRQSAMLWEARWNSHTTKSLGQENRICVTEKFVKIGKVLN